MSEPPEPFLTVGLAPQLEPLADLRYSYIFVDDDGDSDDSLYVGHGVRLQPEFKKHKPQTLAIVLRIAANPRTAAAAKAWAQVLRALDGADDEPHFANLRAFLDARSRDVDDALSPTGSNRIKALRWLQKKTSNPQLRKADEHSRNGRGQADTPHLAPESFVLSTETRPVRFRVRLDLHNAQLAPPPQPGEMPSIAPEAEEDTRVGPPPARRGSLIHRVFDRNRRRSSQAARSVISSFSWTTSADPRDPEYAEAVDDDDELAAKMSRVSVASLERSGASGAPDLARVDEHGSPNPDILSLIRTACAATYESATDFPSGDGDPMPTVLCAALAYAFGWEGVMHLCYGSGSPGTVGTGPYEELGRAADRDALQREKHAYVSSWRDSVQTAIAQEGDGVDMPYEDIDETASIPSQPSVMDTSECGVSETAPNTFQRSWADWEEVLTSLVWWVVEYETGRVRGGLAREYGCGHAARHTPTPAVLHSQPAIAAFRTGVVLTPSPVLVADAVNDENGFQRVDGVPESTEYTDFRWSHTKLHGSHIRTHMIGAVSSLQYLVHQMRTPRVIQSAWELTYLDVCVFGGDVMRSRFPAPGAYAIPLAESYQPEPGVHDRRKLCPLPDGDGAWHAQKWKTWLGTLNGGDIITPVVSWQAWWTLIATLNGADRTGRWFNLQVKDPNESYADLQDMTSVYI